MTIALLLAALAFNMLAQVSLKTAVGGMGSLQLSLGFLLTLLRNPLVWFGGIAYGGSFVFYIAALSRDELGRVGLISQAFTILGLVLLSTLVFHESLTLAKVVGICLLLTGVVMLSLRI